MSELKITSANFDEQVMKSEIPVLVDFWADWCGPCRMLGPIISEIADEYQGKIKVGKVNVDEESELANRFKVDAIPMVVVISNGKITATSLGFKKKADLIASLGI